MDAYSPQLHRTRTDDHAVFAFQPGPRQPWFVLHENEILVERCPGNELLSGQDQIAAATQFQSFPANGKSSESM
jgi:hypothetical protein